MLASKMLSTNLHSVLKDVITLVNNVKPHVLNSRLFEQLCEWDGCRIQMAILHTKLNSCKEERPWHRCLSCMGTWDIVIRETICTGCALHWEKMDGQVLIFMRYIHASQLVTKEFKLAIKVDAFSGKLELWGWSVGRGVFNMLPNLSAYLDENGISLRPT